MTLQRFHVPADGQAHELEFTGHPQDLAVADMGIEFWAEPGGPPRRLQMFAYGEPLPGGRLELIGPAEGCGVIWYLYELARQ